MWRIWKNTFNRFFLSTSLTGGIALTLDALDKGLDAAEGRIMLPCFSRMK
jgi:hypothetical protein